MCCCMCCPSSPWAFMGSRCWKHMGMMKCVMCVCGGKRHNMHGAVMTWQCHSNVGQSGNHHSLCENADVQMATVAAICHTAIAHTLSGSLTTKVHHRLQWTTQGWINLSCLHVFDVLIWQPTKATTVGLNSSESLVKQFGMIPSKSLGPNLTLAWKERKRINSVQY